MDASKDPEYVRNRGKRMFDSYQKRRAGMGMKTKRWDDLSDAGREAWGLFSDDVQDWYY